jgi:hypothetical protein
MGEPRDLPLLRSQFEARIGGRLAHPRARGSELTTSALGERLHADRHEVLVCRSELLARLEPASVAAEPLPKKKMCTHEVGSQAGASEPVDGVAVGTLGGVALTHQGRRPGLNAERPVSRGRLRALIESRQRVSCGIEVPGPDGGLRQLAQDPTGDEELGVSSIYCTAEGSASS